MDLLNEQQLAAACDCKHSKKGGAAEKQQAANAGESSAQAKALNCWHSAAMDADLVVGLVADLLLQALH